MNHQIRSFLLAFLVATMAVAVANGLPFYSTKSTNLAHSLAFEIPRGGAIDDKAKAKAKEAADKARQKAKELEAKIKQQEIDKKAKAKAKELEAKARQKAKDLKEKIRKQELDKKAKAKAEQLKKKIVSK